MPDTYEIVCDQRDIDEWREHRNSGIGASEIAAVLGVSPYLSRLDLWGIKTGRMKSSLTGDEPFIRIGHALEPVVKELLEEQAGVKLATSGFLLRSKEWPWMLSTPDFTETDTGAPWESKGTGRGKLADWEQGVPNYYKAQLHSQMAVLGTETCGIGCLTADPYWTLLWDRLEMEPGLMAAIIEEGERFWWHVENDTPPPPMPDEESPSTPAIKELFPDYRPGREIDLPPEFRSHDEELRTLKARIKEDEARKKHLEEIIKFHIAEAEAEFGRVPGGRLYKLTRVEMKEATFTRKAHTQLRLTAKEA